MNKETETQALVGRVKLFQEKEHKKAEKRIRYGFISMLLVPVFFLVLLFLTGPEGSARLIILTAWIISMFLIAVYLIAAEYNDYRIMHLFDEEEPEGGQDELS